MYLVFIFVVVLCLSRWTKSDEMVVNFDRQVFPRRVVDERFLSFSIGVKSFVKGTNKLPLHSEAFRTLARALAPAYVRLGGTDSDRLAFTVSDQAEYQLKPESWLDLNEFAREVNARVLFALNVLLREGSRWNYTDACELMRYTRIVGYSDNVDYQLGNEPDSFPHVFNVSVPPDQLARDFVALKTLIEKHSPMSYIVGPDTTRPRSRHLRHSRYIRLFMENLREFAPERPVMNAISWHQYYLNGHTAVLEDFWNPDTFDLLESQIHTMKRNIDHLRDDVPMWLSETSSAYGGGAPGLSNSFAASPLWLDKLGTAAKNGIDVVVRQSLFGANYPLIGKDLRPLPDWWISLLHKTLVGKEVIKCSILASKYQRLYCHCSTNEIRKNGSVTLFGSNLSENEIRLRLTGDSINTDNMNIDQYVLTSPTDRLSKNIMLNGELLNFTGKMPQLIPNVTSNNVLYMPKYSLGFWVIHGINIESCR